jgi:hypothetical protein
LEIFLPKITYSRTEKNQNKTEELEMNNSNINSLGLPTNPVPNHYYTQNNYAPVAGAQTPFYSQPILQPAGMVYLINSSQELNTIPTNAGLTLYWCDNENKVYIRNLAGGSIQTKEFYLSTTPNNSQNGLVGASGDDFVSKEIFEKFETRLSTLESKVKSLKGGNSEWQL